MPNFNDTHFREIENQQFNNDSYNEIIERMDKDSVKYIVINDISRIKSHKNNHKRAKFCNKYCFKFHEQISGVRFYKVFLNTAYDITLAKKFRLAIDKQSYYIILPEKQMLGLQLIGLETMDLRYEEIVNFLSSNTKKILLNGDSSTINFDFFNKINGQTLVRKLFSKLYNSKLKCTFPLLASGFFPQEDAPALKKGNPIGFKVGNRHLYATNYTRLSMNHNVDTNKSILPQPGSNPLALAFFDAANKIKEDKDLKIYHQRRARLFYNRKEKNKKYTDKYDSCVPSCVTNAFYNPHRGRIQTLTTRSIPKGNDLEHIQPKFRHFITSDRTKNGQSPFIHKDQYNQYKGTMNPSNNANGYNPPDMVNGNVSNTPLFCDDNASVVAQLLMGPPE
ncbi:MAG: hypothetical protein GY710_09815 [Desulfobacteraceae bacterium]|nr:hypothetical protein [Desulfobacteraceae bacterium]